MHIFQLPFTIAISASRYAPEHSLLIVSANALPVSTSYCSLINERSISERVTIILIKSLSCVPKPWKKKKLF